MNPFEKLDSQIGIILRGLNTLSEDLKAMSTQKVNLHSHVKDNKIDPTQQKIAVPLDEEGTQIVTRDQIAKSGQEKKLYSRRSIEPITKVRKDLSELKEADINPEKQFVNDKINELFRNFKV